MEPLYSIVDTANIQSVDYEKASKTLYVKLKQGTTSIHYDVPEIYYVSLLSSDNIEQYYLTHIKGKFKETKINR